MEGRTKDNRLLHKLTWSKAPGELKNPENEETKSDENTKIKT